MNKYLNIIYNNLKSKHPNELEYLDSVYEFLISIDDLVSKDIDSYEKTNIIESMLYPDRVITFKVTWEDRYGINRVNTGYRIQFNQALGPYKGGTRFHKSVNESILKFLSFEQTFKNSLTGIPMGGAKGGSDFDPSDKTELEIKRFSKAYMRELYRYLSPTSDIPAGDIGVSKKELGYMFGEYKKLTHRHEGVLTSKDVNYGGSLVRTEATGYGICYMAEFALKKYHNTNLKGKKIIVSGTGNVGLNVMIKAHELGAIIVGTSNIHGVLYHENGLDINHLRTLNPNDSLESYLSFDKTASFNEDLKHLWKIKCDIAIPAATQNELNLDDAKNLVNNKIMALIEGANMPSTLDATNYFIENKTLFVPSKAANAGGVLVSGLEMHQNAIFTKWSFDEVDSKLKEGMSNIFNDIYLVAKDDNQFNLVKAANVVSFIRIYNAMLGQDL